MKLEVRQRQEGEQCPYCRDRLQGELFTCPGCETRYHAACRVELGRCGTLGCSEAEGAAVAPRARGRAGQQNDVPPEVWFICAMVTLTALVSGVVQAHRPHRGILEGILAFFVAAILCLPAWTLLTGAWALLTRGQDRLRAVRDAGKCAGLTAGFGALFMLPAAIEMFSRPLEFLRLAGLWTAWWAVSGFAGGLILFAEPEEPNEEEPNEEEPDGS